MPTIPQTISTEQHVIAFDAALRDARAQLPRTADATRADRGLVLALNGHVHLHSPTEAHVTSGSTLKAEGGRRKAESARDVPLQPSSFSPQPSSEVVYHVHARGGCDCPDGARRLEQMPDVAPGVRACKHWFAAVCTAMAHVNLAIKGYTPAADEVWYPAVAMDEEWFGHSGYATETEPGLWWFCFADWSGGFYTDVTSLELYERTPLHVTDWQGAVQRWERWLRG